MKQLISVYLDLEERLWLNEKSNELETEVSSLVRKIVKDARKNDRNYIGEVNRSLENARLADELKNQL